MILKFSINYFLFFSTIAVSVPYLQVLLREEGFSSSEIGLLLGFFEVTGIIGPLIAGWAADKIGRYRFLILILSLGSGVTLFALNRSGTFLFAGTILVLFGLLYRPIPSLQDALSSRLLRDPVKQYGSVRIWGSVGFIVISLVLQLLGILNSNDPGRIVSIFALVMGLFFVSTVSLPEVKTKSINKDRRIRASLNTFSSIPLLFWIALATAFFIKLGLTGYYSFFTLFLKESYQINGVSAIWAIGALAEMPMLLWGSRLILRYGSSSMLVLSVIGASIRMFIYASGLPLPVIITGQMLHAFSFGLIHITIVSIINNSVPKNIRALAMSIYGGIGFGLAGFIGSSLNGYILENSGFTTLYIFCGIITLVPLLFIFLFRKSIGTESFQTHL